ncbi:purine-binding chemotaxis protein CheW [bacterium]|nr:purine-binding chemotaxis protein CheW [bacterium]
MMKESNNKFVLFSLEHQQFALSLSMVESIARSVEIIPLPNVPDVVQGIINVHGRIIPVVNIRQRFHFPQKEIDLDDHLIIGRTSKRSVAIMVDDVEDIVEIAKNKIIEQEKILPGLDHIEGAAKIENDVIIIHDLEKCLSMDEELMLNKAIDNKKNKRLGERERKGHR